MKIYKSSDLTHKRAEVMREAELNGVIIQERRTNGEVVKEFVLVTKDAIYINQEQDSRFPFDRLSNEYAGLSLEELQKVYNKSLSEVMNNAKLNKGDL